jgi:hypothetical protein
LLAFAFAYTTSQQALSSPNERSRLYLTIAIFEHHSFAIDGVRYHFGAVLDEATHGGHFFTDKAPGASLLALIPYALLRGFVPFEHVSVEWAIELVRLSVMVPCGIAAWWLLESLGRRLRLSASTARYIALVTALGTPVFHYSAAFFGHQIVATCFIAALYLLERQRRFTDASATTHAWLAGCLVGFAGITEYQSVLGVLCISIFCIAMARGRWLYVLAPYLLGGLPFAVWLALYQKTCFGGWLELSYHHLAEPHLAELHRRGIGGVELPTVEGSVGILFSLHRGLFATSPWFALVPLGLVGWWRRGHAAWACLIGLLTLLELWFVAASVTWDAGWGYGSRLLVPVMPLLALAVGAALSRSTSAMLWGLANSAAVVGIASFQVVTALFPEPPNELYNPWIDVVTPLAANGLVAPNWGARVLGLAGWHSLIPQGIVVALLLLALARATRAASGGWRWSLWVATLPALWFSIVLARGPSATADQRAGFVQFVSTLNRASLH